MIITVHCLALVPETGCEVLVQNLAQITTKMWTRGWRLIAALTFWYALLTKEDHLEHSVDGRWWRGAWQVFPLREPTGDHQGRSHIGAWTWTAHLTATGEDVIGQMIKGRVRMVGVDRHVTVWWGNTIFMWSITLPSWGGRDGHVTVMWHSHRLRTSEGTSCGPLLLCYSFFSMLAASGLNSAITRFFRREKSSGHLQWIMVFLIKVIK